MLRSIVACLALGLALAGCTSQHTAAGFMGAEASRKSQVAGSSAGWYLMQPPVRHGDPHASMQLANWEVIAYFERVSECDAARERGLSAYASYVPVATTSSTNSVTLSQQLASSTLCVAADDPRVNWFHPQWKQTFDMLRR